MYSWQFSFIWISYMNGNKLRYFSESCCEYKILYFNTYISSKKLTIFKISDFLCSLIVISKRESVLICNKDLLGHVNFALEQGKRNKYTLAAKASKFCTSHSPLFLECGKINWTICPLREAVRQWFFGKNVTNIQMASSAHWTLHSFSWFL